jgi:hypothetical protein
MREFAIEIPKFVSPKLGALMKAGVNAEFVCATELQVRAEADKLFAQVRERCEKDPTFGGGKDATGVVFMEDGKRRVVVLFRRPSVVVTDRTDATGALILEVS